MSEQSVTWAAQMVRAWMKQTWEIDLKTGLVTITVALEMTLMVMSIWWSLNFLLNLSESWMKAVQLYRDAIRKLLLLRNTRNLSLWYVWLHLFCIFWHRNIYFSANHHTFYRSKKTQFCRTVYLGGCSVLWIFLMCLLSLSLPEITSIHSTH